MPSIRSCEAIVLRSFDIGEGDRLCILLTREEGRLAARARGVRKPKSRFGSSLLPLQRVQAEVRKGSAGYTVVSAHCLDAHDRCRKDVRVFYMAELAVAMLLRSLEDEEPVPEVYDLTAGFLRRCERHPAPSMLSGFTLSLLRLFGLLPSMTVSVVSHHPFRSDDAIVFSPEHRGLCLLHEEPAGIPVTEELRTFLLSAGDTPFDTLPPVPVPEQGKLDAIVQSIAGNQLGGSPFSPPTFAESPLAIPTR